MNTAIAKLAGAVRQDGQSPVLSDWLRAFAPLVAPLVIMLSGSAIGALAPVGLVWIVFMIPGWLAANLWFPQGHPLGAGVARLGIASVLALFPFSVLAYLGCVLHWRLTPVIGLHVIVSVVAIVLMGRALLRRQALPAAAEREAGFDLPLTAPRWAAVVLLVAIGVMLAGVCLSSPDTHVDDAVFSSRNARPGWWHGAVLGLAASLVGAATLMFALVRAPKVEPDAKGSAARSPVPPSRRKGGRAPGRVEGSDEGAQTSGLDLGRWVVGILWIACVLLTLHLMRATYTLSIPKMEYVQYASRPDVILGWDVDDVAYISEATDYRYGAVMGRYDASVGGKYALSRSRLTPLVAPLVAMIARATGIDCPSLQHTVMPPLAVLIGVSCYAAVLMVVFRMHRWVVPLGLLVVLLLILKTWDYARCVVEMLIYRAMQPKALQLWWVAPLQFASLILLARKPGAKHFALVAVVAIVGHLTHPLATIMGMVFGTAMVLVTLIERRQAVAWFLATLAAYCALAGEYRLTARSNVDLPGLSSDRRPGEPLETRDLLRSDVHRFTLGKEFATDIAGGAVTRALSQAFREKECMVPANWPIELVAAQGYYFVGADRRGGYRLVPNGENFDVYEIEATYHLRHDPFWTFGNNTLYLAGSLAVPLVIALGVRRRELLYLGLLGGAVLISTNFEPLGRLLNVALPTAIFWRARWMVPTLVNVAVVAGIIYWAVGVIIRGRAARMDGARSMAACLVAVGAVGLMLMKTDSRVVTAGKAPVQLSKFPTEVHELVPLLGGVESDAFVWGTLHVHHMLPQLMPNVQLVFSREKFMRPADDPSYRQLVEATFAGYSRKTVEPTWYDRLLALYPIDHVVVDYGYGESARMLAAYLAQRGWERVGRTSRRFEVWCKVGAARVTTQDQTGLAPPGAETGVE